MANSLHIEIVESPEDAPNYARDEVDVRGCQIVRAIIVKKGTQSGKPTVDFQIVAHDGSIFVAMLTGAIVKSLAGAVAGVEASG